MKKRKNIDIWIREIIKQFVRQYKFEFKEKTTTEDWLDICEARNKEYIDKKLKMYKLQILLSIKFDKWIGLMELSVGLADYLSNKKDFISIPYYCKNKGKDRYLKYRCKYYDGI